MASRNTLPSIHRYITTHSGSGHSILETAIPSHAIWRHIPEASFFLGYVTTSFPIDINDDADISTYTDAYASPPKVTYPGGTVLRVMDLAPGKSSPMHRTVSLDYGVVLEGAMELVLDSGETKVLRRGDMCVQRATMHAYRNRSKTEWARMLMVYVDSTKPVVGGKELGESMVEGRDPEVGMEVESERSEATEGGREIGRGVDGVGSDSSDEERG